MKIGIYGGTFNPPHLGHQEAARAAISQLGLDQLIFIPAAIPPHKELPEGTAPQGNRLEMTRMMADGLRLPNVVSVSSMEMERAGASYTVDTLMELRNTYPEAELYLLMGTDMFETFHQWRNPAEIMTLATICAFGRAAQDDDRLPAQKERLEAAYGGKIVTIHIPDLVEISSTELRAQLADGMGAEYLSPLVYGYILRNGLYGTEVSLADLPVELLRPVSLSMIRAKRVAHVLGTEETAVALAKRWGADETDAQRAAILHDCTKYWSPKEHIALCDQYKMKLDAMERSSEKLLHAKSGACLAKHVFGENKAVVDAISWHTTARGEMTLLEKIIYMADYMEPNRDFDGVEELRTLAYTDLDRAMLVGVDMSVTDMAERDSKIHPKTLEAQKWLRELESTSKE